MKSLHEAIKSNHFLPQNWHVSFFLRLLPAPASAGEQALSMETEGEREGEKVQEILALPLPSFKYQVQKLIYLWNNYLENMII